MKEKKKSGTYETCSFCKGTGKVRTIKTIRKKCADCQDHNHGCFGSGRKDGLGNPECCICEEC